MLIAQIARSPLKTEQLAVRARQPELLRRVIKLALSERLAGVNDEVAQLPTIVLGDDPLARALFESLPRLGREPRHVVARWSCLVWALRIAHIGPERFLVDAKRDLVRHRALQRISPVVLHKHHETRVLRDAQERADEPLKERRVFDAGRQDSNHEPVEVVARARRERRGGPRDPVERGELAD